MSTLFLRPTGPGQHKQDRPWRLAGSWGSREYPASTKVQFYGRLYDELVASGLLPPGAMRPTNKHHDEVTVLIMKCSWVDGRWVPDQQ
jgi:hypothetical protein